MEARRHARRVPPEGPGIPRYPRIVALLALPNKLKPQTLVAVGFRAVGVAGILFI